MITVTGRLWFPLLRQLDCQQGAFQGGFTLNPMEEPEWTNFEARSNALQVTTIEFNLLFDKKISNGQLMFLIHKYVI